MRLLLSLAGGAHDEPTMLERCAAAACFQLESCIKAVLRMMEGSAEGFSALSISRNQVAISVASSWRQANQQTHRHAVIFEVIVWRFNNQQAACVVACLCIYEEEMLHTSLLMVGMAGCCTLHAGESMAADQHSMQERQR